MKKRKNPQRIL